MRKPPGGGGGGGGQHHKFLTGEAPPQGPAPYPFIYHFSRKKEPLSLTFQMVPVSLSLVRTLHPF